MSAIDTASRVIAWAKTAHKSETPPPQGDVRDTEQLAHPPASLCSALAELTILTGARLRLPMPLLGDKKPINPAALVIAAAIGVASAPQLAGYLFKAVPPPGSVIDWLARHGVVSPSLPYLTGEVADDCRMLSPLTALLNRPAEGQVHQAMNVARYFLRDPKTRLFLTLRVAQPTGDVEIRRWRYDLLMGFMSGSQGEQDFVLDVYEAIMVHYQREAMAQVKAAHATITGLVASENEEQLLEALSVAAWWEPLFRMERTNIDALRARLYLGYEYRNGIALFKLSRKLTAGGKF